MAYTRVIQSGNITELYEYEKSYIHVPRRHLSPLERKRMAERRKVSVRSQYSIQRSVRSFFRLVHHNNTLAQSITFCTITFATDISFKTASRYVSDFFSRVKKIKSEIPIRYISVPEKTKRGRYHFHLLIYDLPTNWVITERETRNFQRLFRRGYIDFRLASHTSTGIAGYMAKYMAKSFKDEPDIRGRGYNCSRSINKVFNAGGNALSNYLDLIIPDGDVQSVATYDTLWLGRCNYKKIIKDL